MTTLSASALETDPVGCAFLRRITNSRTRDRAQPSWLRATLGFVGSTALTTIVLAAMAC